MLVDLVLVGCSCSAVGWLKPDFGREHFELIYDLEQKNGRSSARST